MLGRSRVHTPKWIVLTDVLSVFYSIFPTAQQPQVDGCRLIMEDSRSHSDTPHSVWLLRTSDQSDTKISTWHHTTLVWDRQPYPRRDSNPILKQASESRLAPKSPRGHWEVNFGILSQITPLPFAFIHLSVHYSQRNISLMLHVNP